MSDNVIILGAGASKDAGVPLLAGFVEKMLDFHQKGTNGSESLSADDKAIFQNAINIINELDGYHGRAAFDDRNIEDILSILSFEVIGGEQPQRDKWEMMIKAIARTIELTCTLKHAGGIPELLDRNIDNEYTRFWIRLFRQFGPKKQLPTIINLNYDLVLERSLFQLLNSGQFGTNNLQPLGNFPFDGIRLEYHYKHLARCNYRLGSHRYRYNMPSSVLLLDSIALMPSTSGEMKTAVTVEILKLHGSMNFPATGNGLATHNVHYPTEADADPYILPPIFNKLSMSDAAPMWKVALSRLRAAKKIFIVGYSLPRTDIYMQYVFKTALGPNRDLRGIVVFNPALFREDAEAEDMKRRYGECFAPQFQKLIDLRPRICRIPHGNPPAEGTFEHFSESILGTDLFF